MQWEDISSGKRIAPNMQSRDHYAFQSLGDAACSRLKKARVVMVGAGGIGCELLKNLVLMGIPEIHVVDLDTIDLSNLNRQFLFRHEHIKRSKAEVAKQSASQFNPNVHIVAHHANIKDPEFGVKWFRGFDIVYNALDNVDARRHVNRICLAANVPLIESGTAGFNGQVQVIVPGLSECYDCHPKPISKSFAVCTIRSTPSLPIHCVVWAKSYLLSQIFDDTEEEAEISTGSDNVHSDEDLELAQLQKEANALRVLREAMHDEGFAENLFNRVFDYDIQRLASMESMWHTRQPPQPVTFAQLFDRSKHLDPEDVVRLDHTTASVDQNFVLFCDSLSRLTKRFGQMRLDAATTLPHATPTTAIPFDKDDQDTMDFVSAAANLRAYIFGIPISSKFELKQIAGNIIPAIATTNAMVAGLCVLQSLKVLNGNPMESARNVFISRLPERIFNSEPLHAPKPDCIVSGIARAVVKTDPSQLTLQDLVESLLKLDLGYTNELSVVTDQLLYDPDFDDNLDRTLSDLKITDGSFVTIIDEEDEGGRVNLELYIEAAANGDKNYTMVSKPDLPQKKAIARPSAEEPSDVDLPHKRKQHGDRDEPKKRSRVEGDDVVETAGDVETDDNVVEIDDDDVVEID